MLADVVIRVIDFQAIHYGGDSGKVAGDTAYRNARENSDRQNAPDRA